jgi:NADPH-dependent 2,4-dienoyl-CoA reductase/sulfur reductase-like enzyme
MRKRVVILGGGTGGTLAANRLRRELPDDVTITLDLFGLTRDDFIDQVKDIITVGEFYGLAAGGQIIFT